MLSRKKERKKIKEQKECSMSKDRNNKSGVKKKA